MSDRSAPPMTESIRLRELKRRIDLPGAQLPEGLCRDIADLLEVMDVTLALIGSPARRLNLCASSHNALALDRLQFTMNEGPCLEAVLSGISSHGSTTAADVPWPQFAAKAADLGYMWIGAIPLAVEGRVYGAMGVQHSGFSLDRTLEDAGQVAEVLGQPIMSRLAEKVPPAVDVTDYAVVHQAGGMVSAQMGIPIDAALAVLRSQAWSEGRLLAQVAGGVVDRDIHFEPTSTL